ncbi:MAG: cytochrome c oxidase subunit 3 [Actinomycetota bacterium]|nr:cytochrome c oxidase subunit 3 [Actinomycetota bacterium]
MSSSAFAATATTSPDARTRENGWWGMLLFIATEATIFGILFATYFYLRFKNMPQWPPDGIKQPTLSLPLFMSAFLLSSSIPMHVAELGIKKGKQTWLKAGLAVSFLLGVGFLVLMIGFEYPEKLKEFTPQTDVYGSLFFLITGLHGSHVLVGLVMNLWTQVKAWSGRFDERHHLTVLNVAAYWHFVDAIWVFVFLTIYFSPRF